MSYPNYSYPPAPQTPQTPTPSKRKRNIIIAVAAVAVVLVCCCVAVAALLYFDPFGWGVLGIIFQNENTVAKAAPADSTAYVGIDLLNATPDKINPLISAFEDAFQDATGESVGDLVDIQDQIDNGLDDFDISIEEDILPWVGRYAGMGLLELDLDSYGYPETVNFFVAIAARNRTAADEFLVKLSDGISDAWDVSIDTNTYQDTTIYVVDDPYQELAFARYKSLVILANSEDSIEQVIDAEKGDSIADDSVYRDLVGKLPSDRLLTFYLPGSALADLSDALTSDMGLTGSAVEDIYAGTSGIAFSIAIVDTGLQLDSVVAYDPDQLSDSQRQLMEAAGRANNAADHLPGDTLLYFAGQRLDLTWATYTDTLNESTDGDFDEALAELEDEIGIDINSDLFPYLDGAYAMAVFPSDEGFLAEYGDINLGIAFIAQTSDEAALLDTLDNFNRNFEDLSGLEIDDTSSGDMMFFEAIESYSDLTLFAYGVGSGWLGLATSVDVLEALPDPSSALSDNENFRRAQSYLTGGMNIIGFVDLVNGLDEIRHNLDGYARDDFDEATFMLNPIETLVVGSSPFSGNTAHSTFILVIPTSR
jgi:hypothetical protein